jgi:hypothetical protein
MHAELLKNLAEWRDHFIAQTHPAALTLMAAIKTIEGETATRLNAEKVTADALAARNRAEADRDRARAQRDELKAIAAEAVTTLQNASGL